MTSREFCYWLQGFFEIRDAGPQPPEPLGGPQPMTAAQAETVRRHLALVFKHEIDPSQGDEKTQAALNAIHNPNTQNAHLNPGFNSSGIGGPLMRC